MDIRGRVVLVTGASRGIGAEIARAFAAQGARLVLTARSRENLETLRDEIDLAALIVAGDVRDPALDERLLELTDSLGGVDIFVNNAGVENFGVFVEHAWKDIEALLSVNLLAPMRLTHSVLPGMLARDRGAIVNIASLAGLAGTSWGEGYCTSKHGLVGFTRALRATLAQMGSRVSASVICPGFVSEVGMYVQMERDTGSRVPAAIGTSSAKAVAEAVLTAVRKERACVIVNPVPLAPVLALSALFPNLAEKVVRSFGVDRFLSLLARRRSETRAARNGQESLGLGGARV